MAEKVKKTKSKENGFLNGLIIFLIAGALGFVAGVYKDKIVEFVKEATPVVQKTWEDNSPRMRQFVVDGASWFNARVSDLARKVEERRSKDKSSTPVFNPDFSLEKSAQRAD